jgi:hypothetical protein
MHEERQQFVELPRSKPPLPDILAIKERSLADAGIYPGRRSDSRRSRFFYEPLLTVLGCYFAHAAWAITL